MYLFFFRGRSFKFILAEQCSARLKHLNDLNDHLMLILSSASEFVFESPGGRLGFIVRNHGVHHVEKCNIVTLEKVNRL